MHPKLIGNPLVAWIDDTTLQVGWGERSLRIEQAPRGLAHWLTTLRGVRDADHLVGQALACGIGEEQARDVLADMRAAGLFDGTEIVPVALQPAGLVDAPLRQALEAAGVAVVAGAEVLVFPQGQLPSLLSAPMGARRLVPVWFAGRAVHVGPVIDDTCGPCPRCVDLTWADRDPAWWSLVGQASAVPVWHEPAQLTLAAGAIAHIAGSAETVGLEMIFDPARPGPCWRVWQAHPRCECRQPRPGYDERRTP